MKIKFILLTVVLVSLLFIVTIPSRAHSSPGLSQPLIGVMLFSNTDKSALDNALKVIDYDFFQWALFPATSRQAHSYANNFSFDLVLGEQTIDTAQPVPDSGTHRTTERDFHLVQLIGPTKESWRQAIEATGVDIVQYIHPFTYIVYGDDTTIAKAASAEFVRWNAHFSALYRQPPHATHIRHIDPIPYRVVIYQGASRDIINDSLRAIGIDSADFVTLNQTWAATNLTLSKESADALAQTPGIFTIQPVLSDGGLRGEMSNQLLIRALSADNLIQPGYLNWLSIIGINGQGVTVAAVDNGIQNQHSDLTHRLQTCSGSSCGNTATSNHGTHTAAIIAGDASSGTTLNSFLRGLGVAPRAHLVEQLYNPTFSQANGMLTLMQQSVQNDASISSNSWGPSGNAAGYDNDTMQVDIGVRDADNTTAGNQSLNYMLSIMNGYGGSEEQGTPDEAKNVFTVGSTNLQSSGNATQRANIFDISNNSAHGPALDGRIIPHIVAPGCYVDSALTSGYGTLCGTSMAAPQLAGGAALFTEKYRANFATDPSPALIKAAFTAVADSLAGNKDADGGTLDHPFDHKQGWGLLNLASVISPTAPALFLDQTILFTETGQTHTLNLQPTVAGEPVRIMLAWTDAPGHGLGGRTPAWNNNLDLIVTLHDETYVGNQFDNNGWSMPSNMVDTRNNTEGVFFENLNVTDKFQVVVSAANISSDGVPNNNPIDQDFALACYNCQIVPEIPTAVELSLEKTASAPNIINGVIVSFAIGSIITYTITRNVTVTKPSIIPMSITDASVHGLQVLSETIRLNGEPHTDIYDAVSGQITFTNTKMISVTDTLVLSYQARVTQDAIGKFSLTNTVVASGNHENALAKATISLVQRHYLPIVQNE